MKNPFELIDDGVMYGVNKAVQGWNYVTGRDKYDLANVTVTAGYSGLTIDSLIKGQYGWAFGLSFMNLILVLYNNKFKKRELKALESGLKLPQERYIEKKQSGYLMGFVGGGMTSLGLKFNEGLISFLGLCGGLISFSEFTLCADVETPHKKNVLSRKIDEYKESKLVPAEVSSNYEGLEGRV